MDNFPFQIFNLEQEYVYIISYVLFIILQFLIPWKDIEENSQYYNIIII